MTDDKPNRQPIGYRDSLGRYAKLYPRPDNNGADLGPMLAAACVFAMLIGGAVLIWGGR